MGLAALTTDANLISPWILGGKLVAKDPTCVSLHMFLASHIYAPAYLQGIRCDALAAYC